MFFFFCSIGQIIKREQSRKRCQLLWFCFYFSSLCDWSKIICTILSTNQVQNPTVNQSKPDHPRFPRLKKFFLFSLWIIFGSQIGELTIRSWRLKGYKTASSVLLVKKNRQEPYAFYRCLITLLLKPICICSTSFGEKIIAHGKIFRKKLLLECQLWRIVVTTCSCALTLKEVVIERG